MEAKKYLSYLLALSLTGCVVLSLHPLSTEKDVVFEQKVTGVWFDEYASTWQFKGIDDPAKAYEISLTDKDGKKGLFIGHLVKLEDKLFLDIRPKQFPAGGEDVEKMELFYNAFFFVPAHTFLPVDSLEPELKMRWADADKIKELLEKDPNAIKHEIVEDTIVLTAPTKELQQFVLKYAGDRKMFGNEIILRRTKAVKPSEAEATDPAKGRSIDLGGGITMEFVLIPAGSFYMGSPSDEKDRDSDEGPVRRVQITKSFWIGKFEVTQDQYSAVMGSNPSRFSGPDLPVDRVSWLEATQFCEKLTAEHGGRFRLPTEAEWEYACRAGSQSRFCYGDDPDYTEFGQYAWHFGNSGDKTHSVGQKRPNKFGVYDMHGNVWEWCSDWWARSYENGASVNPTGPASGEDRVLRGGGWYASGGLCRSAVRNGSSPVKRFSGGFRVVLDLE